MRLCAYYIILYMYLTKNTRQQKLPLGRSGQLNALEVSSQQFYLVPITRRHDESVKLSDTY